MAVSIPEITGFDSVESWLRSFPEQMMGIPTAICQTGEPYVEFLEFGLARPADVRVIEAIVARKFVDRIGAYLGQRAGHIYWRIPFERSNDPAPVVVRYDELGPDKDFITDRKCVMDKDWVRVACYCRLYRASSIFDGFDFSVTPRIKAA